MSYIPLYETAVTAKLIIAFVFATWIVQFFCSEDFKRVAIFCGSTDRFLSDLVENPEDRFSSVAAHI